MNAMKIHHCNGDTYTGDLIDEDTHRIWIKNPGTGRVYQIMKSDILARSENTPAPLGE